MSFTFPADGHAPDFDAGTVPDASGHGALKLRIGAVSEHRPRWKACVLKVNPGYAGVAPPGAQPGSGTVGTQQ